MNTSNTSAYYASYCDRYKADFKSEMGRFQEYMRSTSKIKTVDRTQEISHGGFITPEFMDFASSTAQRVNSQVIRENMEYYNKGEAIWNSPSASTSLDYRQSKSWAQRFGAPYAKNARHGILFKAQLPKEGTILTFGQDLHIDLSDLMDKFKKDYESPFKDKMIYTMSDNSLLLKKEDLLKKDIYSIEKNIIDPFYLKNYLKEDR